MYLKSAVQSIEQGGGGGGGGEIVVFSMFPSLIASSSLPGRSRQKAERNIPKFPLTNLSSNILSIVTRYYKHLVHETP